MMRLSLFLLFFFTIAICSGQPNATDSSNARMPEILGRRLSLNADESREFSSMLLEYRSHYRSIMSADSAGAHQSKSIAKLRQQLLQSIRIKFGIRVLKAFIRLTAYEGPVRRPFTNRMIRQRRIIKVII
jgi:hypothetical protein